MANKTNFKPDIKSHFSKKFEFKGLVHPSVKCSQPFENLPWEVIHDAVNLAVPQKFIKVLNYFLLID